MQKNDSLENTVVTGVFLHVYLKLSIVFHKYAWKIRFIHKVIHTLWITRRIFHKGGWETQGKMETYQIPLISLTISSISVLKMGSWRIRFSMASREEMTVEWSLSRIFPIPERFISATVKRR